MNKNYLSNEEIIEIFNSKEKLILEKNDLERELSQISSILHAKIDDINHRLYFANKTNFIKNNIPFQISKYLDFNIYRKVNEPELAVFAYHDHQNGSKIVKKVKIEIDSTTVFEIYANLDFELVEKIIFDFLSTKNKTILNGLLTF